MMKPLLLGAAISMLALTAPSLAAPAAPAPAISQVESNLVQVQKRKVRRHQYRAGHRYKTAPRGWYRHQTRPHNWQTRGCILVGVLWFCP